MAAKEAPKPMRCDFCGEEVAAVRRVALDANYERLQTPHQERYACERCSERKDRQRRGLERR
jgi:uncharacterized protein with PIN domain